MNTKKSKVKVFWAMALILIVLSLIPYSSRILNHIDLSLIDEDNKPLIGCSGYVQLTLYPTLEEKSLIFIFNDTGSASLNEQVIWMCWIKRRFYDLLNIISHDGWSTPSGKIIITFSHKEMPSGTIRVAELLIPKMEIEDWGFCPDGKGGINYREKTMNQFWSLDIESSLSSDTIKLFIEDIRKNISAQIKLKIGTRNIMKCQSLRDIKPSNK